jgi:hypothetical protein
MSDAAVSAHRGIRGSHDERRLTARWADSKPIEAAPAALPSIEISVRMVAEIFDYNDLWRSVRDRVDAMELTRSAVNELAGLPDNYISKVLGPSQVRKFGNVSLGPTLGSIGCRLVLVEDPVATERIMKRRKRKQKQKRPLKLLAPPSQPAKDVNYPG